MLQHDMTVAAVYFSISLYIAPERAVGDALQMHLACPTAPWSRDVNAN